MMIINLLFLAWTAFAPISVHADDGDPMIEIGTSVNGGTANVQGAKPPSGAGRILYGTISITHDGQLRIVWDGLSANLGSDSVSFINNRTYWTNVFPSVTIDLQALFGKSWMQEMDIKLAGGTWDDNPIRGTQELTLGQISLNLTQNLIKRDALSWSLGESAGIGAYYSVLHDLSNKSEQSFPTNVTLNSKIVARISPKVLLTATVGAYATLVHKYHLPDDLHWGAIVSLEADFGERVSAGICLQGEEQITFSNHPTWARTAELTAYLKFLLAKTGRIEQSLTVSLTASYDEENPTASGDPNESLIAGAQYVVSF